MGIWYCLNIMTDSFTIVAIIIAIVVIAFRIRSEVNDRKLISTVTSTSRGTRSERATILKLLKFGIRPGAIFHDLYLIDKKGKYFQIDLVVATKVGILVFEVKEYSGWIFGSGDQTKWTQVLAYGREKYRFYNPIIQNRKHVENLNKQLVQFKNIPIFSIVVFWGDCVFKDISSIPQDTYLVKSRDLVDVVESILNNNEPANYINKREIVNVLHAGVKNGEDNEIRNQHIKNIEEMLARTN